MFSVRLARLAERLVQFDVTVRLVSVWSTGLTLYITRGVLLPMRCVPHDHFGGTRGSGRRSVSLVETIITRSVAVMQSFKKQ